MSKHLIFASVLILWAGTMLNAGDTTHYPALTDLGATHQSGRTVRLFWTNPTLSNQQTVHCDVERDGTQIYTGVLRQSDAETGGQIWHGTGTQYFYDHTATPGSTHTYAITYRTEDGTGSLSTEIQCVVPMPRVVTPTVSISGGRNVTLSMACNSLAEYSEAVFDIYRDDQLLATLAPNTAGDLPNGDGWTINGASLLYYDRNGIPGTTHSYRVTVTLYNGGPTIEASGSIAIPLPQLSESDIPARCYNGRMVSLGLGASRFSWYPDRYITIYRDDMMIADFSAKASGTLENGNSVLSGIFHDVNGIPGQTHEYKVAVTLYEGGPLIEASTSVAIPLPAFSEKDLWIYNYQGRRVHFQVGGNPFSWYPDRFIEIFRDGEKLAGYLFRSSGTLENGNSWSGLSFYDIYGIPGQTHEYRAVVTLYENGPTVEASTSISIPLPEYSSADLSAYCFQGHKINIGLGAGKLSWYPERFYEIYRDDVKLAEFPFGTVGTMGNGNSWGNSDSFVDVTGIPGETYQYRVKVTLFKFGPPVEAVLPVTISLPEFSDASILPAHVRGQQVQVRIKNSSFAWYPKARYQIYRDNQLLADYPANGSGSSANGDRWSGGPFYDTFTDSHAKLDAVQTYRVVVTLFEGGPTVEGTATVRVPALVLDDSNLSISQGEGRPIRVRITHGLAEDMPDIVYNLFRDGVMLGRFTVGSSGMTDIGNFWDSSGNTVDFYDVQCGPFGTVHEYRVVFEQNDGSSAGVAKEFAVPFPILPELQATSGLGGSTLLSIPRFRGFPDLWYEIYRDGVFIQRVKDGSFGGDDTGNQWDTSRNTQYFTDFSATTGEDYTYRVVYEFYDACSIDTFVRSAIGTTLPCVYSFDYLPVIKRLPTREYLLGLSIARNMAPDDATVCIDSRRNDVIFAENGMQRISFPAANFDGSGFVNLYVVAPANTNFENDKFWFNIWIE